MPPVVPPAPSGAMPLQDEPPVRRPELLPLAGIALLAGCAWWWSLQLPPPLAWLAMLAEAAPLGILVVATSLLLAGGAVDLALGALAVIAAMLAARLPAAFGLTPLLGAACAVIACATLAALHGMLITLTRRPAWIVTGTMLLGYAGLSTLVLGLPAVAALAPARWEALGWQTPAYALGAMGWAATLPPVPLALCAWVLALLLVPVLLHTTAGGNRILALGASPGIAQGLGVPVLRSRAGLFAAAGLLAAVAGLLDPGTAGPVQPVPELSAVAEALAAAIIGGGLGARRRHAFAGGALAVLLVMLIGRGVAMVGLPPGTAMAAVALLLLLALALDVRSRTAAEVTG